VEIIILFLLMKEIFVQVIKNIDLARCPVFAYSGAYDSRQTIFLT